MDRAAEKTSRKTAMHARQRKKSRRSNNSHRRNVLTDSPRRKSRIYNMDMSKHDELVLA